MAWGKGKGRDCAHALGGSAGDGSPEPRTETSNHPYAPSRSEGRGSFQVPGAAAAVVVNEVKGQHRRSLRAMRVQKPMYRKTRRTLKRSDGQMKDTACGAFSRIDGTLPLGDEGGLTPANGTRTSRALRRRRPQPMPIRSFTNASREAERATRHSSSIKVVFGRLLFKTTG